ncbi:MAG: FapA family protein, partial [Acidobacteriota bacterium]
DEAALDIIVSEDKLNVYLRIKEKLPERITARAIKNLLRSKYVVYGLFEDEKIDEFLKQRATGLFPVAQGRAPQPGRDARIRLHQSLVRSDNAPIVDFRSAPKWRLVKKGDLLAEKTPYEKEIEGIDVYGQSTPMKPSRDRRLLCGSGAELSVDGHKILAKMDGKPQISVHGKISVLPVRTIQGDVDLDTGNVEFPGSLTVTGIIQDGFKVRCAELTVTEISKALVQVSGDLVVLGGILGARIRAGGGVRAVHMHDSRIEAMGDIIVEKGFTDSRIVTASRCKTEKGTILSTSVIARQGLVADQIGTDRSDPCTLVVGVDPLAANEMEHLEEMAAKKRAGKAELLEAIRLLNEEMAKSEQRIGTLAQEEDKAQRERRELIEDMETNANDQMLLDQIKPEFERVDDKVKALEGELEKLFGRQEQIRATLAEHQKAIEALEREIERLKIEVSVIAEWLESNPGCPCVTVLDTAYAGTEIECPTASFTLESDLSRALVREGKAAGQEHQRLHSLGDMHVYKLDEEYPACCKASSGN